MTNDIVPPWPEELIPAVGIAGELVTLTGSPGPGVRKMLERASNAELPLEKRGRFWFCRRSRLPELAHALGLRIKAPAPRMRRKVRTEAAAPIAA
jgi:hypothetical protein